MGSAALRRARRRSKERRGPLNLWTTAYILAWLRAFAFTQLVEAPIYRGLVKARWTVALGASAITHPFVWFAFPYLRLVPGIGYLAMVIVAELFAWLVEAVYLRLVLRISWRRAVLASLAANSASLGLGILMRSLTGYP